MMDYRELRKLKAQLIEKENKTEDELHLLMELQSLSKVIDTMYFSIMYYNWCLNRNMGFIWCKKI